MPRVARVEPGPSARAAFTRAGVGATRDLLLLFSWWLTYSTRQASSKLRRGLRGKSFAGSP